MIRGVLLVKDRLWPQRRKKKSKDWNDHRHKILQTTNKTHQKCGTQTNKAEDHEGTEMSTTQQKLRSRTTGKANSKVWSEKQGVPGTIILIKWKQWGENRSYPQHPSVPYLCCWNQFRHQSKWYFSTSFIFVFEDEFYRKAQIIFHNQINPLEC